MISCSCDDWEIRSVGEARIVMARKSRQCNDCEGPIHNGDVMYVQSMYDFEWNMPEPPHYMCEKCGDLAESLLAAGYCFQYGDIRGQWQDHLEMRDER